MASRNGWWKIVLWGMLGLAALGSLHTHLDGQPAQAAAAPFCLSAAHQAPPAAASPVASFFLAPSFCQDHDELLLGADSPSPRLLLAHVFAPLCPLPLLNPTPPNERPPESPRTGA